MIGHHQPVGQQLQRIERRINHDFCIRHLPPYGIGKAEEQRVAAGKDHYLVVVLLKDSIERHSDVNPLCILRKQRLHYLVVALASREHIPVPYHLQDFGREKRQRVITNANNVELHCFNSFTNPYLVSIAPHHRK